MPMYRFQCEHCGKRFEELTSYSQRDTVKCPDCGGTTRVLVAGFAVNGGSAGGSAPTPRSSFS